MPKLDYRNIEIDATRCGGQPVVSYILNPLTPNLGLNQKAMVLRSSSSTSLRPAPPTP